MSTKRNTKVPGLGTAAEGKRKQFAIRMRPSIFEAGQIAAKKQNRSLASLMETLLILHLREHDLLPKDVEIEMRQLEPLRSTPRSAIHKARGGAIR